MAGPFRRRVFYIPGYDPYPPRRYREIYRREGARQAGISGYGLHVRAQGQKWHVLADMDGAAETEVEVLVWSDIVQTSMQGGVRATYAQMLRTAWIYLRSGALRALWGVARPPLRAAMYPVAVLLAQLLVALLPMVLALWLLPIWAALPLGALALAGILRLFRRHDNRFLAYYLMHDYAFTAAWQGANPPELEERLDQFRAKIAEALESGVDEVLVVGHSSGAHLGVSILADLLRGRGDAPQVPLGLLTLGHVVPMVSFLPEAGRLRRDLHDLSREARLTWIDVTAPGDPCTFALCDPVGVSGVAPADQRWPCILSAAFSRHMAPERWRALRWRFFQLHFQYLHAFEQPGIYDYFAITAGPMTLAQRFAGRASSPQARRAAMSPHRGMS
ncbi:hypothetical protein [Falsirhodobacter algicola]|uniref:Uncharacterized protein n=1 Tax=Falsirhodobacter algicola TaxID=2692330 RepID=A0A8J8MSU4_9RHOB|nr:hypothetical protein [Falsirhodobacter algicola]QUS35842.1 hypothetical protein GR316_05950 [Falsirhodobacter algicola]